MSKNLTRKGLALTAVVALGASFFAGTPASAADLGINNGSVSLAPNAGTNYAVLTDSTFVLKANSASGVTGAGKYLKFKVSDLDAKVSAASIYSLASTNYVNTSDVVTITVGTHKFKVGDKVSYVTTAAPVTGVDTAGSTITAIGATTISFAEPVTNADVTTTAAAGTVRLLASYGATRGTGTSFILDSKIDTNLSNKTISLSMTDHTASRTVDVTSWIDDNDNGVIDATEYQSPTRTVKFLIPGDVVSTTTFRPASAGDATVTADVTTVPALNGDQINAGKVVVEFGRPSETTLLQVNATWSDDDQKFTATSANFNSSTWLDIHASKPAQRITAATGANDSASYSVTKNVATVVTDAAHGLQVGDFVAVAGVGTRANTASAKVTAVPTTTSFSYAVDTANESTTDVASTTSAVSNAITAGVLLRDTVQAGTVTAQNYIYKAAATAGLVKNGVQASYAVGAKVASAITVAGVGSATVSADGTAVYKGTTSAAFTATIKNSDGDAVAAGVDVTILASKSSSGTVTLNGTTLAATNTTLYAKTDATGQVAIAVTNTSGAVGDSVTFSVASQGVTPVSKTATWADKVYGVLDLNDQTTAGTARNRAVAEGAAYTFDLLVQDQFKAPAGSDIRLVVATTGNTVSTNTVALTAGKASVAVADGGLTTGAATVAVSIQKLTDGIWAAIADASGVDWDGNAGELGTVAVNYYTQTDAITLNADAANYPSSTVADLAATATAATPAALDSRVANGTAPAVLAADKAVVSGKVTNASTGAAKSGVVVSFTAAGLLFKSGDVWSIGSASVLSNDGTFEVEVYSAAAGDKVVTVAVGAVTKTATVTFTGLGASKTNVLSASGATSVQAGRAVDYTATVVDKLGNAVSGFALKATVTGSGYFAGSVNADGSASLTTDVNGKAVVKVLFSSNDQGTAVITFVDNDASTATADNLKSIALSTEVGSTDAQIDNVGKRVTAVASFTKGKTVSFYVDGVKKWSKLSASDADVVLFYNLKKGRHTVTMKISGGFITSEVIIVK
jgi:trimeric autotransporter adhesin